jgi:hypothetical protein
MRREGKEVKRESLGANHGDGNAVVFTFSARLPKEGPAPPSVSGR